MIPFKTEECNFDYFVNPTDGKGQMPCIKEADRVTSFWKVERDDPLFDAEAIYIQYSFGFKPPTSVGFGNTVEGSDLAIALLLSNHGDFQTSVSLNNEAREWLNDGGCFVLRTFAIPPPPVQVWMA